MSDPPTITLAVGDRRFEGWTDVSVSLSIDQLADSFQLSYVGGASALPVNVGDACVVSYGKHKLITGWINQADVSIDKSGASASCGGRSKSGDLVDCAAIHKTGQWLKQTLTTIIKDLCAPFGIAVSIDPQIETGFKFDRFEVDEGERVYDAMERLLRATGIIAISQPDGGIKLLRITRTAGIRSLQLPVQFSYSRQLSHVDQDTYSVYRLRNQTGRVNPTESPRHAALEKFEIKDENVKRYRPYVLNADTHARVEELKTHATWERNTRAGKALSVTYVMPGIMAPDGSPWSAPMLVGVDDPALRLNEIMLVSSVEFRISKSELETRLVLSYPEAYSLLPLPVRQLNKGVSLRG